MLVYVAASREERGGANVFPVSIVSRWTSSRSSTRPVAVLMAVAGRGVIFLFPRTGRRAPGSSSKDCLLQELLLDCRPGDTHEKRFSGIDTRERTPE